MLNSPIGVCYVAMHMHLVTYSGMDLDFENCGKLCLKSAQSALPLQIVITCGSTKHTDIFEISDRLVSWMQTFCTSLRKLR